MRTGIFILICLGFTLLAGCDKEPEVGEVLNPPVAQNRRWRFLCCGRVYCRPCLYASTGTLGWVVGNWAWF